MPEDTSCLVKPDLLSTEAYGMLLLLISAMLFSGMGCFLKLASTAGLPSTELVFVRAVFQGTLVVGAMTQWRATSAAQGWSGSSDLGAASLSPPPTLIRHPFGGTPEVRRIVVGRGAAGGLGFIMYFYTITKLPLGDAVTLLSLYPILTVFVARAFLGEAIKPFHLVAAACSAAGAVLIARPTFLFGRDEQHGNVGTWLGYLTAAIGSCCGSAVLVLMRKAGKVGAHTLQLLFSWALFGLAFSLVFATMANIDGKSWQLPPSPTALSWKYVLGMCSVGSVGHFIMNYAGRLAPAGLGSIMRSSDLLWAYLWEVLVFGQRPMTSTIAGAALVCASLVIVTVQRLRDEKNELTAELSENLHKAENKEMHARSRGYGTMEQGLLRR